MKITVSPTIVIEAASLTMEAIAEARLRKWEEKVLEEMQPKHFLWRKWKLTRTEAEAKLHKPDDYLSVWDRCMLYKDKWEAQVKVLMDAAVIARRLTNTVELSHEDLQILGPGFKKLPNSPVVPTDNIEF